MTGQSSLVTYKKKRAFSALIFQFVFFSNFFNKKKCNASNQHRFDGRKGADGFKNGRERQDIYRKATEAKSEKEKSSYGDAQEEKTVRAGGTLKCIECRKRKRKITERVT